MSPNSNTSSLDPQNGSAYNLSYTDIPTQPSAINIVYSAAQVHFPAGIPQNHSAPTQQPAHARWSDTNGYQYENERVVQDGDAYTYINEGRSTSASTYNTFSSSEYQQESAMEGQGYQQDGQYYLPATTFPPQDQPRYDMVLAIDSIEDEQAQHWDDPTPSNPRGYGAAGFRDQQSSAAQQTNQTTNIARTPTARRWSHEYSPEERMRVGLPRWETEQHRIDYERRQSQRRQQRRQQCEGRRRS